MDPISIGLALATIYQKYQANKTAQEGIEFQKQNLASALAAAQGTQLERTQQAGGIRQDQFGNATYYDPNQGRWITLYTPTQQRMLQADQARQERTLARGAQASEDYARQRAGYLYNQPPTEATIRDEIMRLVQQSQGQGERALNTITDRWGVRTAGNIPTLQQMDRGPDVSQQLADTMLKARAAALGEYGTRQTQHANQYLPALKMFEGTANTAPEISGLGKDIVGLTSTGQANMLNALADYGKQLSTIYGRGGQDTGSATAAAQRTEGQGYENLINALKNTSKTDKTTGKTTGGTPGPYEPPTSTSGASTAWTGTPVDVGAGGFSNPSPYSTGVGNIPVNPYATSASSIGLPTYGYPVGGSDFGGRFGFPDATTTANPIPDTWVF